MQDANQFMMPGAMAHTACKHIVGMSDAYSTDTKTTCKFKLPVCCIIIAIRMRTHKTTLGLL